MNIKPVSVACQEGVEAWELEAVLHGVRLVLEAGRVFRSVEIENSGVWRADDWLTPEGHLADWRSVDWYLWHARAESNREGQLNGQTLMRLLLSEPWRREEDGDHYDVFVLADDMYDGGDTNFVLGLGSRGLGTVLSVHRLRALEPELASACITTLALHEFGHACGLIADDRPSQLVDLSLGRHCMSRCVMRQGLQVPDDWLRFTQDRLLLWNFCPVCNIELRRWFRR